MAACIGHAAGRKESERRPRKAWIIAKESNLTATNTTANRTIFDALIWEPVALAVSQPHQIALSCASVALMGSFASASGILHPAVAYVLAVGVEWAYLKGLASDSRAPTGWGTALNWSAFGIVVLWGVLFVASMIGAIDLHTRGFWGWLLAAAHVVPIAWLSLCSAMTHRAALALEAIEARRQQQKEHDRQERIQADQDAIKLEADRKAAELAAWEAGQRAALAIEIERKTALRAARANTANTVPAAAPGTPANSSREQLREQVARTLREHPKTNKAELARRLGIGRTLLYELIKEIQQDDR